MVLNSLNLCLSVKLLTSPANLNESLDAWSILGCSFFSFITLNILCHSLLACRFSAEKLADNLLGLDCKEIQPVHPKGDQSWVFIGRIDVEGETAILWPPDVKS